MIIDTSGLLAALFSDQRRHRECASVLQASVSRVLSPFVLAEVDYLVTRSAGVVTELALLREVARGAYELAPMNADDVATAAGVVERYGDLSIGLADASLVVLADRHGTRDILTLDVRHFRAMRTLDGKPFRVLPADA